MHYERSEKSIASVPIYLVANNLQLHNTWNFSNSTDVSGACDRYWGSGRPVRPTRPVKTGNTAAAPLEKSKRSLLFIAS